ncbi:MAG: flagellar basal body rod C-terminal domain-containing protein, partial [Rhodocyclaceae bacterium]|nr:flagellar basal body rod C-terminal domain-containing protein [Rhodocyclaceae bacterium]
GTISVTAAGGAQNTVTVVGRIKLVNPPEADLKRGPDGLFRLNTGDAAPLDEGVKVAAGYLENSNVNPVEQMVAMISLARQFEMQIKLLTNAEMNDRAATQVLAQR